MSPQHPDLTEKEKELGFVKEPLSGLPLCPDCVNAVFRRIGLSGNDIVLKISDPFSPLPIFRHFHYGRRKPNEEPCWFLFEDRCHKEEDFEPQKVIELAMQRVNDR